MVAAKADRELHLQRQGLGGEQVGDAESLDGLCVGQPALLGKGHQAMAQVGPEQAMVSQRRQRRQG